MDDLDFQPARPVVRIAAAAMAAAAFLLYLLTLAWSPVPGAPAALIVKHTGLSEIPPLVHPLWNGLCRLLAAIPWGPLAVRIHLACAMLGATAVGLIVLVVARLAGIQPAARPLPAGDGADVSPSTVGVLPEDRDEPERWLRASAGVLAGLILALCVPLWLAATRASTLALEAVPLLAAVLLFLRYGDSGHRGTLAVAALVWGLGMAESPAMVLLLPLPLLLAGWGMARHGQLPPFLDAGARQPSDRIATAILFAALTVGFVVPTAIQAIVFGLSPAPAWLGMNGSWDIVVASIGAVYDGVKGAVPRVGWMLIAVVSAVPAILFAWVLARPPHLGAVRLGWTCLFLALFGAALVLNAPFAPWPLSGGQTPPTMPYLWIAAWSALAVSTLFRLLLRRARRRVPGAVFPVSLRIAAGAAAAVALAAGVMNFPHADGRAARPFGWLARGIVGEAAGADWMISHGLWDDIVQIVAHGRTPPLRTIRWNLARQDAYLAWLSHRLAAHPRLAGLAPAGLEAVVPVWLASTSAPPRSIVALDLPETFTTAGIRPVPGAWIYHRGTNDIPSACQSGRELDRWRATAATLRTWVARAGSPLREYGDLALRHAGRIMNDRGVFLEDTGRPEDAIRAYTAALDANPSNLVARINLSRVVRSLDRMETVRVDASLVQYLDEMPGPVDIVSRTTVDGILRDPAALAASGLRRFATGDTQLAVTDLLAALSLGGISNDVAAAAAARALASQGRMKEANAVLDEASARMPGSGVLQIARSHVALADRNPTTAEQAMAAMDPKDPRRRLTAVLVSMAREDWKSSDALLRDFLQESPTNADAIALSAVIALRLGQPARVRSAEAALRASGQKHPVVSLGLAVLLLDEKRTGEARQVLEGILARHPNYRPAREALIRLEKESGRTAAMREHVFALLRQSPDDPKANLQMASWQIEAGRFDLAEASLRAVLDRRREPAVLNNLAWTIRQQGRAAEALPMAEETVHIAPDLASGWDTLAVLLSDAGRPEEALEAAARAERLAPENRAIRDHAALLRAGRPIPRPRGTGGQVSPR